MITEEAYRKVLREGNLPYYVVSRFSRAHGLLVNKRPLIKGRTKNNGNGRVFHKFKVGSTNGAEMYDVHLEYSQGKFVTGSCSCPDCQRSWRRALGNFEVGAEYNLVIPARLYYDVPYYISDKVLEAGFSIEPGSVVPTRCNGWGGVPVWRNSPVCKHMFYAMMWLV